MKFQLEPHNRDVPDDELIADLKRVAGKLGKSILTMTDYDKNGGRGLFSDNIL